MKLYERIYELAFNRLFYYPSNERYGGIAGFYDYGPIGVRIKKRIEDTWRKLFIIEEGFGEVESTIITPEIVLKASGHVDEFTDPVAECKKCHSKIRADKLLESSIEGFKWNGRLETINEVIKEKGIKCPICGGELGEAYNVNLMFKTEIGYDGQKAYLRPETAQGIFTAFPRIFKNMGGKLPMAIGQIGRSFRNEISPRKGLVRLREFTQMELEYFFKPGEDRIEGFNAVKDERIMMKKRNADQPIAMSLEEIVNEGICNEIMAYLLYKEWLFYKMVGVDEKRMWFRHLREDEMPHYSKSNIDLEVETSYGIIELAGNAYRTDYDLRRHEEFSKSNFSVNVDGEKFIPHVVEASMGLDRLFFTIMEHTFREKTAGKEWEWFDIPPIIAPYDAAVFPLMKKDGLKEKALEIAKSLREKGITIHYREGGSIGRRYARADEVGIPYAITIDYQTLDDNTVTLRYRNDGKQERVEVEKLVERINNLKHKNIVVKP